ncbi:MAG: DNA cytosine methyltransferase [Acidobacteriota bacterium]
MRAVEIFAGAGGLALGVSQAGFSHDAVIEVDRHACATIKANQVQKIRPVIDWPLFEQDVSRFDFSTIQEGLDLLCGGPPCQPFSLAGKSLGHSDARNMFPATVSVVRQLRPRAFLFENVKGLLRRRLSTYLEYVRLQLSYLDIRQGNGERWEDHLARLERHHTKGAGEEVYRVLVRAINAADYGVPQRRERVFIVGIRSDLGVEWSFPEPTHSQDELLFSKYITADYWERHEISKKSRPTISLTLRRKIEELKHEIQSERKREWLTVRDALKDLPRPERTVSSPPIANHTFIPGARMYVGHTGSVMDEPAKTLKAGDHGVPGGENMLLHPNGKVRYFTVRECARLQTFPDEYEFPGPWSATTRQLGNAVPVLLALVIAGSVKTRLSSVRT